MLHIFLALFLGGFLWLIPGVGAILHICWIIYAIVAYCKKDNSAPKKAEKFQPDNDIPPGHKGSADDSTYLRVETTGLDHREHRIVFIRLESEETGDILQSCVNPERDNDPDAVAKHGITDKWLRNQPVFKDIADDVVRFIGNSFVIQEQANKDFGRKFLNMELRKAGKKPIPAKKISTGNY